MKLLQELAQVARLSLPPSSLEGQYLKLLKEETSYDEAKAILFGDSPNANQKLNQVAFRLKKKLIADIATQNAKKNSSYASLATEAHQLFVAGRILIGHQAHKSGVELLQKAYKLAMEAQLLGIALECARTLSVTFSSTISDSKKFLFYQESIRDLLPRLNHEITAQGYYNEINQYYLENWDADMSVKAFTYCAITGPHIQASTKTAIYHFNTLALAHISALDFEGLVNTCEEAINHFAQLKKPPRATVYDFRLKKAVGHIQLGEYAAALESIDIVLSIAGKGSFSFCTACFYRALTGIHAEDIEIALNAIQACKPYLQDLPENIQEQWRILTAYVALFSAQKFKLARFLNEVPIFSKDKAGANAAILIVQMLHFLKEGKTSAYIERCDALSRYTTRYLKGKHKVLAELLLEVPKGHFKAFTVQHRTKKLVKALSGLERELEIMPAERVWRMVMGWLG